MEEITTCPLAAYEIKPVPALDAAIIRFSFLTTALSEEPQKTPNLLVHTAELRRLAQRILEVVSVLETTRGQGVGPARH